MPLLKKMIKNLKKGEILIYCNKNKGRPIGKVIKVYIDGINKIKYEYEFIEGYTPPDMFMLDFRYIPEWDEDRFVGYNIVHSTLIEFSN